jgi:hypothetical protein
VTIKVKVLTEVKKRIKELMSENEKIDALTLKDDLRYTVSGLPSYIDPYVEQARQDLGIQQIYEDAGTGRIKVFVK